MKKHFDSNANEHLDDETLVEREASERREYLRMMDREPQLRDTTYKRVTASPALMRAWRRWSNTSIIAKLRGLLLRQS